ncbi:uncharacterized protein PHALS_14104 [Plasmopara halstedii]|uniref:Uncharacterized protein n=1 Tax=Plasmopara halstedii TaxID=4781 RepID=A0A0P1ASJ0_PLAHL|nr:uncharacterized protein PHALS_14104 [Plasmopara halstedii]CEG43814.1 hypothetical protein PHALS_14104 [Plasmopara halstedii]|eukprot:XP_024580183.1 hypothetical protein PHALS_14104 [Plasmopara halstedii]
MNSREEKHCAFLQKRQQFTGHRSSDLLILQVESENVAVSITLRRGAFGLLGVREACASIVQLKRSILAHGPFRLSTLSKK